MFRYFSAIKTVLRKTFLTPKDRCGKVIVLLYHRITDSENAGDLMPNLINASLRGFEEEINFLTSRFNIVSSEKAVSALRRSEPLPGNAAVITFDDGYKDNYIYAFPVLQKYKVPATVFMTADFIDGEKGLIWIDEIFYMISMTTRPSVKIPELGNYSLTSQNKKNDAKIAITERLKNVNDSKKNEILGILRKALNVTAQNGFAQGLYLSGREMAEMSRGGIIFGSHGCSHSIMTKIPPAQAREEAARSKARIEQVIGKKVNFFAYPNGARDDFNAETGATLKEAGYEAAFTTVLGADSCGEGIDLFALKRIPAGRSLAGLKKNLFLYS